MENEETLESLKEENQKLKELGSKKAEIVSIGAHQIRTSLSAIKWILKMFTNGDLGKINMEQESLMKKAYEDNDRAIETVNEILLANKAEDIIERKCDFKEVDIIKLIDDSIFDFSGETHTKEIEILFLKPDKEPIAVLADKEKLRIVFQNLLENAIKYSNEKGKIFVALKKKEDSVEVLVKDNGVGISEEGKSKIFEKFYRDKEAQKKEISGIGIGLFTAKKIIEGHKGKIWFESDKNEGTTFFFTVPIFIPK